MNTVWVLEHEHKHGVELSVHRRRRGAERAAARIIRSVLDAEPAFEFAGLREALDAGHHDDVLAIWEREAAEHFCRYLRVHELPVLF